jgi:hypothetical protein
MSKQQVVLPLRSPFAKFALVKNQRNSYVRKNDFCASARILYQVLRIQGPPLRAFFAGGSA